MKGIENISRSIVDEAKAKAEQILEEARQQAARIGEKAAQQAQAAQQELRFFHGSSGYVRQIYKKSCRKAAFLA